MDILPAILSTDAKNLARKLRLVEQHVPMVHVDIMDGQFVPTETIQAATLAAARAKTGVQIHLMAYEPESYVKDFAGLADEFVFHLEATDTPVAVANAARQAGLRPGLALNPDTPAAEARPHLSAFDLALVMSVHPGASGQAFIPAVLPKIKELKGYKRRLRVGIDGGIGVGTCCQAARAGASFAAAASSIFGKKDIKAALLALSKDAQCARKRG